ncbi:hypothetical protein [Massilia sp. PWRC2]|uniref:hypothetical protein n=1 Tax=Massilia sp. PWRC2 TaxID=2804626 RepID=UPI003CE760C7
MKARHLALGAALLVAAAFAIFGDRAPADDVVEAAPRRAPSSTPAGSVLAQPSPRASASAPAAPVLLALVPREILMEEGAATGSAFSVQTWTAPPAPPPAPAPPPPPLAPPLPFVYLGKVLENGAWEVFLARGSETLIVRTQMVVDGVYRIDAIAPPAMTMTYLPLKQVQQINIGVPE